MVIKNANTGGIAALMMSRKHSARHPYNKSNTRSKQLRTTSRISTHIFVSWRRFDFSLRTLHLGLMAAPVDISLAKEEAQEKQDNEVQFYDGIMKSLSEEDRARAEADPLDALIIVRGYASEKERMEATIVAMRKICEWRASVGYYEFFDTRLPGADDFYKWWPEQIHGSDKYGHFLQCLRAADVDADSLEKVCRNCACRNCAADQMCKLTGAKRPHEHVMCRWIRRWWKNCKARNCVRTQSTRGA